VCWQLYYNKTILSRQSLKNNNNNNNNNGDPFANTYTRIKASNSLLTRTILFTVGSYRRVKQFTTEWQMFRWWRWGWKEGAKLAETTDKRLLCCEFWRTGKAMGQVYQCWWRIRREIHVIPRFEYHMFYVLYPFVTYLLTLLHKSRWLLFHEPSSKATK
jgi:hypothetical protein